MKKISVDGGRGGVKKTNKSLIKDCVIKNPLNGKQNTRNCLWQTLNPYSQGWNYLNCLSYFAYFLSWRCVCTVYYRYITSPLYWHEWCAYQKHTCCAYYFQHAHSLIKQCFIPLYEFREGLLSFGTCVVKCSILVRAKWNSLPWK